MSSKKLGDIIDEYAGDICDFELEHELVEDKGDCRFKICCNGPARRARSAARGVRCRRSRQSTRRCGNARRTSAGG